MFKELDECEFMNLEPTYRIRVRTIDGEILKFHKVLSFELDNGMVKFTDSHTGKPKIFSTSQCEIEQETGNTK